MYLSLFTYILIVICYIISIFYHLNLKDKKSKKLNVEEKNIFRSSLSIFEYNLTNLNMYRQGSVDLFNNNYDIGD